MKLNVGQLLKKNSIPSHWNHFLGFFSDIPASGNSFFRLVETEFSSYPSSFITILGWFQTVCFYSELFFLLLESITEIRCKSVFSIFSVSSSGSNFSSQWKRIYYDMWKRAFFSVLLFRVNVLLTETIIKIKVKPFLIE